MKPALPLVLLLALGLASPLAAAPPARAYHLQLEATPAAAFPFLGKFGKVDVDVFAGGFRAESLWLNGFSRNGAKTITVENPLSRMYGDMLVADLTASVKKLASYKGDIGSGAYLGPTMPGKVHGIDATRYRLMYGPDAYVDLWTTTTLADCPQFRSIVTQFVQGISPGTAKVAERIPGVPLYVELNFAHYKKLPILRVKELKLDNAEEADALKTGTLYFRAPMIDALWK